MKRIVFFLGIIFLVFIMKGCDAFKDIFGFPYGEEISVHGISFLKSQNEELSKDYNAVYDQKTSKWFFSLLPTDYDLRNNLRITISTNKRSYAKVINNYTDWTRERVVRLKSGDGKKREVVLTIVVERNSSEITTIRINNDAITSRYGSGGVLGFVKSNNDILFSLTEDILDNYSIVTLTELILASETSVVPAGLGLYKGSIFDVKGNNNYLYIRDGAGETTQYTLKDVLDSTTVIEPVVVTLDRIYDRENRLMADSFKSSIIRSRDDDEIVFSVPGTLWGNVSSYYFISSAEHATIVPIVFSISVPDGGISDYSQEVVVTAKDGITQKTIIVIVRKVGSVDDTDFKMMRWGYTNFPSDGLNVTEKMNRDNEIILDVKEDDTITLSFEISPFSTMRVTEYDLMPVIIFGAPNIVDIKIDSTMQLFSGGFSPGRFWFLPVSIVHPGVCRRWRIIAPNRQIVKHSGILDDSYYMYVVPRHSEIIEDWHNIFSILYNFPWVSGYSFASVDRPYTRRGRSDGCSIEYSGRFPVISYVSTGAQPVNVRNSRIPDSPEINIDVSGIEKRREVVISGYNQYEDSDYARGAVTWINYAKYLSYYRDENHVPKKALAYGSFGFQSAFVDTPIPKNIIPQGSANTSYNFYMINDYATDGYVSADGTETFEIMQTMSNDDINSRNRINTILGDDGQPIFSTDDVQVSKKDSNVLTVLEIIVVGDGGTSEKYTIKVRNQ